MSNSTSNEGKKTTTEATDKLEKTASSSSSSSITDDKELAKKVYEWCQERYEYYDELEGEYTGDKYDNEVIEDAAVHFEVSRSEAKKLYDYGGLYIVRGE